MLNDAFCLLVATSAMPLFLLIPGYVLGWLGNIFAFRERRFVTRFLIGIVLSVSVFPAAIYLLARLTTLDVVFIPYGILWGLFLWLMFRERKRIHLSLDRWTKIAIVLTFLWVMIAFISLPDIQLDQRIYTNTVSYDSQTRIALTDSIFRTGIPPANPHIYPGKPLSVSYFYFWFIFPALLTRLTGGFIDARMSFYASIIWVGIALRAAACLYMRLQSPESKESIGPRSVVAIGLFFITGLDILFSSVLIYYFPGLPFITEWWNGNSQVTAWAGASLWVPHHIAGLVTGMTGILLFQSLSRSMSIRRKTSLLILTALSLATLFGLSLYVTLVFAIFWGIYFIGSLVVKKWRYLLPWLAVVGFISILLALPFIRDLFGNRASYSAQSQGGFLVFEVRSLGFLRWLFTEWPAWQVNLLNFFVLPINYFLEFGFFLLAGLLYIQSAAKERVTLLSRLGIDLLLLAIGFILCSFFRSAIIGNNDIGWRGLMPAQFILLIWGANVLVPIWQKWFGQVKPLYSIQMSAFVQKTLVVLLVIGLASTLFDLWYLRTYSILDDQNGWTNETYHIQQRDWGKRGYAIREAYQYINAQYPLNAIVQNDPQFEWQVRGLGMYGMRQTVAAGKDFSFIYGDAPELYETVSAQFLPIFRDSHLTWEEAQNTCRASKIDVLMIKDLDPVWENADSWAWKKTPEYLNDFVRVFSCK